MTDPISSEFANLVAELVKFSATGLFDSAKSLTNKQIKHLSILLKVGFKTYIENTIQRTGSVKTLLYRDRRASLESMYVTTTFEHQDSELTDRAFFNALLTRNKAVIVGPAGSGKSIFTKHATHVFLKQTRPKIPIFVELRYMNHFSSSIMHYTLDQVLKPFFTDFGPEEFDKILKSGSFALILDGFDEINYDRREDVLNEISFMCSRYKDLTILISTREDESLTSINELDVYNVAPLSQKAALDLVSKLDYDEETKLIFSTALKKSLFKSHMDFSSNPLLLTMLLLTYDQVGEVPARMHIFYNQAFETLVLKHDRIKSQFKRKIHSNINIEEVRRVYAYFCAITYFSEEYSFTESRCREILIQSLEYNEIQEEASNVLRDLIESFCMLKMDGLFVTFVHRSFQEYFSAYFVSRSTEQNAYDTMFELARRGENERCIFLLNDMAKEFVEHNWLFPFVTAELEWLEECALRKDIAAFINRYFEGVTLLDEIGAVPGTRKSDYKAVITVAKLMLQTHKKYSLPIISSRDYQDSPETLAKIDKYFGGRVSQFSGKYFEPTLEDSVWLQESVIAQEMQAVLIFFRAIKHYATKRLKSRENSRAGILPLKEKTFPRIVPREFVARAEITTDSGETGVTDRAIRRNVYDKGH